MAQATAKWEYLALVHESAADLAAELNEAGSAGWELVSIFPPSEPGEAKGWTAFLKRLGAGRVEAPPAKAPAAEAVKTKPTAAAKPPAAAKPASAKPKSPAKEPEPTDESGFEVAGDTFDLQL